MNPIRLITSLVCAALVTSPGMALSKLEAQRGAAPAIQKTKEEDLIPMRDGDELAAEI